MNTVGAGGAGRVVGKALVHDTEDLAMIPALQLCDPPKPVFLSK